MSTHDFQKLDWLVCIDDVCWYSDVALQIGRMYWVSDVSFSAVQLVGLGEHWFDAAKFRKASDLEVDGHLQAMFQASVEQGWGKDTEPKQ